MGAPRCRYCGRLFRPDPSTARVQKTCGRDACRRACQRQRLRRWRALHPESQERYRPKMRAWAKAYPDYWRHYRATHPGYSQRDQRRRVAARKRARVSANETAIRRALVEKLQALELQAPRQVSANETPLVRRMQAVEDCLRSTAAMVMSAKHNGVASGVPAAG